jgi:ATPase subunit of ABC transporter with duplicated ATPase domains
MEVNHLYFQHHKKAPYFFKDLSFRLERGKLHALHGKNGTGKTVLLNILSCRVEREAIIRGEVIGESVSLVNQRFDQAIADQFTFVENLKFGHFRYFPNPFLRLHASPFLPEFLEKFHINLSMPLNLLSGGQRQILALLMQLQKKTEILLLDEPTATLDEQNAIMVFDFLRSLPGMTLFVVCHDQELINHYVTGDHFHMEMASDGLRTLKVVQS